MNNSYREMINSNLMMILVCNTDAKIHTPIVSQICNAHLTDQTEILPCGRSNPGDEIIFSAHVADRKTADAPTKTKVYYKNKRASLCDTTKNNNLNPQNLYLQTITINQ